MSSVFENILGFSLKWRFTTAGCFEIPGAFFLGLNQIWSTVGGVAIYSYPPIKWGSCSPSSATPQLVVSNSLIAFLPSVAKSIFEIYDFFLQVQMILLQSPVSCVAKNPGTARPVHLHSNLIQHPMMFRTCIQRLELHAKTMLDIATFSKNVAR